MENQEKIENPFLAMAQHVKNVEPMSDDGTKLFLAGSFMDQAEKAKGETMVMPDCVTTFNMKVIKKRIEVLGLPISFSEGGLTAMEGLAMGHPGRAVTILVDCLTKHEGGRITSYELSEMYPWGFYNEETFMDYVDNYLKTRRVKWSEIY